MPASLTHLLVGWEYQKKYPVDKVEQFYLGCVAPDCVNVGGFASKEVRMKAHLRDWDLEKWKQNAKVFYQRQTGNMEESYLLGYILHIFTDIMWDECFEQRLKEGLAALGLHKEEVEQQRWSEHYRFEYTQMEEDWWKEVVEALKRATPVPINNLPVAQIAGERDESIRMELKPEDRRAPLVIRREWMDQLAIDAAEEMGRWLA